jgi:hypothetical protein
MFNLGGGSAPQRTPQSGYGKRSNAGVRLGSRQDDEWVSLSDHKMASNAQGGTLRDSDSEEHILGSAIKVSTTVEQSTKHVQ